MSPAGVALQSVLRHPTAHCPASSRCQESLPLGAARSPFEPPCSHSTAQSLRSVHGAPEQAPEVLRRRGQIGTLSLLHCSVACAAAMHSPHAKVFVHHVGWFPCKWPPPRTAGRPRLCYKGDGGWLRLWRMTVASVAEGLWVGMNSGPSRRQAGGLRSVGPVQPYKSSYQRA